MSEFTVLKNGKIFLVFEENSIPMVHGNYPIKELRKEVADFKKQFEVFSQEVEIVDVESFEYEYMDDDDDDDDWGSFDDEGEPILSDEQILEMNLPDK